MSNEELHERTLIALARAAISPMMTDEDIRLLCWHSGVNVSEIQGLKVTGYRMNDVKKWEMENEY